MKKQPFVRAADAATLDPIAAWLEKIVEHHHHRSLERLTWFNSGDAPRKVGEKLLNRPDAPHALLAAFGLAA